LAANFKIAKRRKRDTVFLSLRGDFDGSSAYELLNSLIEQCDEVRRVFVDTKGLSRIYPFGKDTLSNNLCLLKGKGFSLEFIGHNAGQIAPERRHLHRLRSERA
jgi:anti-anti-sigma regulatory factor